jgi:tRNA G18 (ribose-2'-O)-methylase SpoU
MKTIVDYTKPRNVIDTYRWMTTDDILKDLADKRHNFSILLCNLKNDVNIGSAIRSHAGFLGNEIILYGHRSFNRVPAIGTYAYSIIKHLKFVEEIDPMLGEYDEVIGCDYIEGRSESIWDTKFDYDKKTLLCFGHEYDGLPEPLLRRCHKVVHIPMFGVTRSFNVAVSAGIVMNEYVRGLYAGKPAAEAPATPDAT